MTAMLNPASVSRAWIEEHRTTHGQHYGLRGPGSSAADNCPLCSPSTPPPLWRCGKRGCLMSRGWHARYAEHLLNTVGPRAVHDFENEHPEPEED